MDAFLILTAILASVVLLFRYAVPLAKPKLSQSERLSDKALENRLVMLAKRCVETKRGFGLYYRKVDIDKILKRLSKKAENGALDKWERAVYDGRAELAAAYDRSLDAMRSGYTLGHVGGYPRLFLLCSEITECRQGDITENALETSLDIFDSYAPLTAVERSLLPNMLEFCLCALLCDTARRAFKREKSYRKGLGDGKLGKADLDGLTDVDYVDGLFDATESPDKNAVIRLFESNGVDHAHCEYLRSVFMAQSYALVQAVMRSLKIVRAYANTYGTDIFAKCKKPSERLVRFLCIMPIVLTVAFAVLACAFVPYEYAAVCVAAAIIFYGCFRLPLLLYAPHVRSFDIITAVRNRFKKASRAANEKLDSLPAKAYADSETAYIGCGPEYSARKVCGGRVFADCDNRGMIRLGRVGTQHVFDGLEISFEYNGKSVSLAECDGAFDGSKYVYRAYDPHIEFAAEIVTPVDCDCCCCKITAVNRLPEAVEVKLIGAVIARIDKKSPPQINGKRIAVDDDGRITAIAFGNGAVFDHTDDKQTNVAFRRISATRAVKIDGFSKCEQILTIAYGASVLEADSVFERVYCEGYFDCATDCLHAFSATEDMRINAPPDGYCMMSDSPSRAKYAAPSDDSELDGYRLDGGFSLSAESKIYNDGYVCNTLSNGRIGLKLYQNSIGGIFRVRPRLYITDKKTAYKNTDKVCVTMGENGVLWSPLGGKLGRGYTRVEHSLGHTTYFCAYNGCVCELECRIAENSDSVLFDLTVKNRVPFARCLDVMISVSTAEKSTITPFCNGISVNADDERKSFALSCSQKIVDSAEYKESYFSHGRIVRLRDFRRGGSTPAPTVSTCLKLEPYDGARVVFCLALDNVSDLQTPMAVADAACTAERELRCRSERVKLMSDDNVLNVMHARALHTARIGAMLLDGLSVPHECAILSCVKYIDKPLVKRRLIELLKRQKPNGAFDERTDCVWISYAVADYAAFACDASIFDEQVEYAPDTASGKREIRSGTVKEHVMRAVDISALTLNDEPPFCVVYYKTLAEILRYYAALCGVDAERAQKYLCAANRAASEFSTNAQRLVAHGCRENDPLLGAAAWYCCGDYGRAYDMLYAIAERMAAHPSINGDERETVTSAVFYTLVTEKLIGAKIRGNRVKIEPHAGVDSPRLEFSLRSESGGTVRVEIDDKAGSGDWRIRADKISYALNSIILGDKDNGKISVYRDLASDG